MSLFGGGELKLSPAERTTLAKLASATDRIAVVLEAMWAKAQLPDEDMVPSIAVVLEAMWAKAQLPDEDMVPVAEVQEKLNELAAQLHTTNAASADEVRRILAELFPDGPPAGAPQL